MEILNFTEIKSLKRRIQSNKLPEVKKLVGKRHEKIFERVSKVSNRSLDKVIKNIETHRFPFKTTIPSARLNEVLRLFDHYLSYDIEKHQLRSSLKKIFYHPRKYTSRPNSFKFDKFEYRASKLLKKEFGDLYDIKLCGRCVAPNFPLVSCRPDGFLVRDGSLHSLVEIKTPNVLKNLTIKQWLRKTTNFNDFKIIDGNYIIKRNTKVYDQIQFSLAITNLKECHLVYYSPKANDILKITVLRNDSYIEKRAQVIVNFFNRIMFDLFKELAE